MNGGTWWEDVKEWMQYEGESVRNLVWRSQRRKAVLEGMSLTTQAMLECHPRRGKLISLS
jgi:hypothetical protein